MEMYGSKMSLIDATYKTTRYDLALFFIAVRTNVGYIIVAEFVTIWNSFRNWRGSSTPKAVESQVESKLFHVWLLRRRAQSHWANISTLKSLFMRLIENRRGRWVRERKHGLSVSDEDVLLIRSSANLCMGTTSTEWRSSAWPQLPGSREHTEGINSVERKSSCTGMAQRKMVVNSWGILMHHKTYYHWIYIAHYWPIA